MRIYLFSLILVSTVFSSSLWGQSTPNSQPRMRAPSPIMTPEPEAASPATMLTPMNGKTDLSLIEDVCEHQERRVKVYRLQNAAANDVADSLNQWLQTKMDPGKAKLDGFICNAPIIIVPEEASNSLIISTLENFSHAKEVETIIKELDRQPPTIRVQAVIKKTKNGVTEVISKPSLMMVENTRGSVTFETPEGQYTIELVARVEPNKRPIKTILRSARKPSNLPAYKPPR